MAMSKTLRDAYEREGHLFEAQGVPGVDLGMIGGKQQGVTHRHKLCSCGHASYGIATSCANCGASLACVVLNDGDANDINARRWADKRALNTPAGNYADPSTYRLEPVFCRLSGESSTSAEKKYNVIELQPGGKGWHRAADGSSDGKLRLSIRLATGKNGAIGADEKTIAIVADHDHAKLILDALNRTPSTTSPAESVTEIVNNRSAARRRAIQQSSTPADTQSAEGEAKHCLDLQTGCAYLRNIKAGLGCTCLCMGCLPFDREGWPSRTP